MEKELLEATEEVESVRATALQRRKRIDELLLKNNKVVAAHSRVVDKYYEKKQECFDKEDSINKIKADHDTKLAENKYLKDTVDTLTKNQEVHKQEIKKLQETISSKLFDHLVQEEKSGLGRKVEKTFTQ